MKKFVSAFTAVALAVTSALSLSASAEQTYVLGDLNNSASVEAGDLLLLKRNLMKITQTDNINMLGDINGDGFVDASDLLLLKRGVLKLIDLNTTDNFKLALNKKTVNDVMSSPITKDAYKLVFVDDFNGTDLNTAYWNKMTQNGNSSEAQANLEKNVAVENGNLVITGLVENNTIYDKNAGRYYDKEYSAGGIDTKAKIAFKYGRLEMRAKLPFGKGMWPAFWTVGESVNGREYWWPWGGEIDILEMFGVNSKGLSAVATAGIWYYPPQDYDNSAYSKAKSKGVGKYDISTVKPGAQLSDDYHVYGVEWNEKKMMFYFDSIEIGSVDIDNYDMSVAFHNDHRLIIQFAMEGFGLVNASTGERKYDYRAPNKNGIWPQKMSVDWVKVWQKDLT